MTKLKLIGGLFGAIALLFLLWAARDRFRLAGEVRNYEACTAAVQRPQGDLSACSPAILAVTEETRRARICEAAAGQGDAGRYALRASCGENVKSLDAELTAARANLADIQQQLAQERTGRAAAVSRAEARSTAQATRRATQNETIRTQPRTPGGSVRCDAACLRTLGGDPPAGGAGPGG